MEKSHPAATLALAPSGLAVIVALATLLVTALARGQNIAPFVSQPLALDFVKPDEPGFMPPINGNRSVPAAVTWGTNSRATASSPNATLDPAQLVFPVQVINVGSPPRSVTLTNYGDQTLVITGHRISKNFLAMWDCSKNLPPGARCTIQIEFQPQTKGDLKGKLWIADNAPDSPQSVSLSGVGTVAEFDPGGLNFGRVFVGQRKSLATKLTNKGNEPLNITSITIAGVYFSQTNDCPDPGKLDAGSSCTITVTFSPQQAGARTGQLLVYDDGGGSPQHVSLLGEGCQGIKCTDAGAQLTKARTALSNSPTTTVPAPTHPGPVGSRVMPLVDSKRLDPYQPSRGQRELLVRFWYPAALSGDCEPAEYTSDKIWSYFADLVGTALPQVLTHSCQDARMADGAHPVVLLTPGYTGTFTDYTFIAEDLASHGYVVVSIDHTHEATAVEFPDGKFVPGSLGSHFDRTWRLDQRTLSWALSVRSADLKFVLDELERLNATEDGPIGGKLELDRMGVIGHSLGGLSAILGVEREPRFKAAVILDGELTEESANGTDKAVLLLTMDRQHWTQHECQLWKHLRGPRLAVNFKGADHLLPSDAVWLAKGAIKTGSMSPEQAVAAVRSYVAAFLDANLVGAPADWLLKATSPAYPGAVLTSQNQSLCKPE